LLFNREGDCLAAKLRPGNVHSADGWEDMLLPEIERQQKLGKEVVIRPVGRPSHRPLVRYKSFLYQAESWNQARRVVAKVEFHAGELFPRVGLIVTNLETDSRADAWSSTPGTSGSW
jgi:hypothetical protein